MLPGENTPPMHPNCHCSTAAYVDRSSIDWLKDDTAFQEQKENARIGKNTVNQRTGGMTSKEWAEYKIELSNVKNHKQIILPKAEYAKVMSEFNTNMSDEKRKHAIVTKPIDSYNYTIINKGFDNYVVIKKSKINDDIDGYVRGI